ncbi:unnamed protein product [Colletotrichum noveboracense]|uniref:Uncharacterized protein n=1 Tax=Colletotrichum noveboracense TaxID=2664923 RepID=A0A9W4S4Y4_9PEZI|nr:unnamed protein product [Colletotrichum noveboracense]
MSEKFKSNIELEVARHYPTQRLNLYSYKPADPDGAKDYIPNPLTADLALAGFGDSTRPTCGQLPMLSSRSSDRFAGLDGGCHRTATVSGAKTKRGNLIKDEDGLFLLKKEVEFEIWMLKIWGPRKERRRSVGEILNWELSAHEKKDKEKFLATEPEATAEADALMLALGLRKPKSDVGAENKDTPGCQRDLSSS